MFTGASENKVDVSWREKFKRKQESNTYTIAKQLQSVLPQVHVVLPQPGSNNAHRVDDKNKNKNIKVELVDKAQLIEDVPFAKEIFQVIILQTYEDLYFFR